jgi:hypothetical protein
MLDKTKGLTTALVALLLASFALMALVLLKALGEKTLTGLASHGAHLLDNAGWGEWGLFAVFVVFGMMLLVVGALFCARSEWLFLALGGRLRTGTVSGAPEPISFLALAHIAELDFKWELFSEAPRAGWQAWDLKAGLEHAANDGAIIFEGKVFTHEPSPNPFFRRDALYTQIDRPDWLERGLRICIPGLSLKDATNFDITIVATQNGDQLRFYDVRVTDRAAAVSWLKNRGPAFKGHSEELHLKDEARREQIRQQNRFADTEQGIDVPRQIPLA